MNINVNIHNGITIININGEIDAATAPIFQNQMLEYVKHNCKIILNMADVEFMSSSGLRIMLLLHRQVSITGGKLVLAALNKIVQNVMEATGFLTHMTVFETVNDGIQYLETYDGTN